MKTDQSMTLEDQIKSLRHEIEKLSAQLTVKKMESRHPSFHKLVEEIEMAEASLKQKSGEAAQLGSEIISHIRHCPYRHIVGRILCMGILGYIVLLGLEWLSEDRKAR